MAYLTVASFVFLAASLGVQLLLPSEHGGEKQKAESRRQGSENIALTDEPMRRDAPIRLLSLRSRSASAACASRLNSSSFNVHHSSFIIHHSSLPSALPLEVLA